MSPLEKVILRKRLIDCYKLQRHKYDLDFFKWAQYIKNHSIYYQLFVNTIRSKR